MTPDDLRAARKALGLTQTQAARVLGYSNATRISEIENGARHPGAAAIRLLRAYAEGYRPKDWPISPASDKPAA